MCIKLAGKRGTLAVIALFFLALPLAFSFEGSGDGFNITQGIIGRGSGSGSGDGYNVSLGLYDVTGSGANVNYNVTLGFFTLNVSVQPLPPPSTGRVGGGGGFAGCEDACEPGQKTCFNNITQICRLQQNRCFDWEAIENCGAKGKGWSCDEAVIDGGCFCKERWTCEEWSVCREEIQTRTCQELTECDTTVLKPLTQQECELPILPITEIPAPLGRQAIPPPAIVEQPVCSISETFLNFTLVLMLIALLSLMYNKYKQWRLERPEWLLTTLALTGANVILVIYTGVACRVYPVHAYLLLSFTILYLIVVATWTKVFPGTLPHVTKRLEKHRRRIAKDNVKLRGVNRRLKKLKKRKK